MEEAITAWNESRSFLLELVSKAQKPPPTPSSPRKRKRRRSPSTSSIDFAPATISRNSPKKSSGTDKASAIEVNSVTGSDVEELEVAPELDAPIDCPMCGKEVVYRDLNVHIDRGCKDPPKPKSKTSTDTANAWSKLMQQPKGKGKQKKHQANSDSDEDAPLPKVSYSLLKDKQIREMLVDHKLPTHGERSVLDQRHQKWVMLYNANLDRSPANRKPLSALRSELKKWEDTVLSKKKKPVVDNTKDYEKRNKSEFAKLVEQARPPKKEKGAGDSSSPGPMTVELSDSIRASGSGKSVQPGATDDSAIVVDE